MTDVPNPVPILPRRAVQKITAYVPPLEGRRSSIRLDFNENTVGFPEALQGVEAEEARGLLTIYPEYDELLQELSKLLDIPVASLLCTNGSDEALSVSAHTFIEPNEDRALTMSPTFGLIPHDLLLAGAELVEIPYNPDTHLYEPETIEAELKRQPFKMAFFASPDNPVGSILSPDIVSQWCGQFPQTIFVLDEAYAEYAATTCLPLVKQFNNLIVTRTFSKAWGLAGLRLGVIASNPDFIGYLKRVRSPYSVNTLAVRSALEMLPRANDVVSAAKATMALKQTVLADIRKRGYRYVEGAANFFMLDVGPDSKGVSEFFRKNGILVRDQSSRPGLQGMIRVSVGSPAEMERFKAVLDDLKNKRILLFDMDGTLVDTRQSFDATVAALVDKYTGKPLTEGELDDLRREGGFNDDWEATVELLKRRGVNKSQDDIASEAQGLYLRLAPDNEKWIADPDMLKRLKRRYRLGVATGRYRAEFDTIWKERFEPLFDIVICQDDGNGWDKKPHPRILHEALLSMGAESGLYVGNSVDDMRAAKAAGMLAVGVTFNNTAEDMKKAGGDWTVDAFDELERRLLHCDPLPAEDLPQQKTEVLL